MAGLSLVAGTALDAGHHSPGRPRFLAQMREGDTRRPYSGAAVSDLRVASVPPVACDATSAGGPCWLSAGLSCSGPRGWWAGARVWGEERPHRAIEPQTSWCSSVPSLRAEEGHGLLSSVTVMLWDSSQLWTSASTAAPPTAPP